MAVLGRRRRGRVEPGPQELNLWGHPVDKLRYATFSWQLRHAAGTDAHAALMSRLREDRHS